MEQTADRAVLAAADRAQHFADFVDSHRDQAVRLAWRLVGSDRATAEDVAQDAFEKAFRSLGRFREDAALSTWFYRILVRQAGRQRRWRAVRERFALAQRETGAAQCTGDPALRRRIILAMDQLSDGQRQVFVLVHLEGFSVEESAELLGRAPGTIKSHLHRALATLRRELRDVWNDDEENRT